MKDVVLTKRQIIIALLGASILLLLQLLKFRIDNYYLNLITEGANYYLYIAVVAILITILEKKYPKHFGKIKDEQKIVRSPFIVYFFFGVIGLIFISLFTLAVLNGKI